MSAAETRRPDRLPDACPTLRAAVARPNGDSGGLPSPAFKAVSSEKRSCSLHDHDHAQGSILKCENFLPQIENSGAAR
jgi:hypothetical protein